MRTFRYSLLKKYGFSLQCVIPIVFTEDIATLPRHENSIFNHCAVLQSLDNARWVSCVTFDVKFSILGCAAESDICVSSSCGDALSYHPRRDATAPSQPRRRLEVAAEETHMVCFDFPHFFAVWLTVCFCRLRLTGKVSVGSSQEFRLRMFFFWVHGEI